MKEIKCGFNCDYLVGSWECEAVGSECIGDMCEFLEAARTAPDRKIVEMLKCNILTL